MKVAIIGSDAVGADLMTKILDSDGPLIMETPNCADIKLVFAADAVDVAQLADSGVRVLDLTSAAVEPYCVPAVNLDDHLDAPILNMVTFGAQAAVPIVAAVGQSGIVSYAEVVSSMSATSAGPATRATIDEFNEATAAALRIVGGAQRGKSIMLLNPADPPIPLRSTVFCLVDGDTDRRRIEADVLAMVDKVRTYAPGYRLKHGVQFEPFETGKFIGTKVTVLLEIGGAAGNIDMITSAAKATAERIAAHASEIAGVPT
jgi:acetaldehyde dehydrogenase